MNSYDVRLEKILRKLFRNFYKEFKSENLQYLFFCLSMLIHEGWEVTFVIKSEKNQAHIKKSTINKEECKICFFCAFSIQKYK